MKEGRCYAYSIPSLFFSLLGHSLVVGGTLFWNESAREAPSFRSAIEVSIEESGGFLLKDKREDMKVSSLTDKRDTRLIEEKPSTRVSSLSRRSSPRLSSHILEVGEGDGNNSGGQKVVTGARGIYAPIPRYPWEARRAKFEGVVLLEVGITREGEAESVVVTASSGRSDCDSAAQETVRKRWKFEPATIDGVPVPSRLNVAVQFSLK